MWGYFSYRLEFNPLNEVEKLESRGHTTSWSLTGNDPHFELFIGHPMPFPPGHYRIYVELPDGADGLTDPVLYVDSGNGYSEAEAIHLHLAGSHRHWHSAVFSLDRGALRLRFDPSSRPAKLAIGRIKLRRLHRIEYYAGIAARLAMRRMQERRPMAEAIVQAATLLRQGGIRALAARLRAVAQASPGGETDYQQWIELNDALTPEHFATIRDQTCRLESRPLISVLMPVYNTPEALLREAIESVRAQIYDNWELCIADDCSTKMHVRKTLEEYRHKDPRIKVAFRKANGNISRASNTALELVTGEWVALLDHDDVLRPHALAEVAMEINRAPDAELIYSDEDKIDTEGRRYEPHFKPDFSRELFRSQNYLNHLTVHRAQNIRTVGGWRPGFEGSQDYDLNLRILEIVDPARIRHIPKVLYHWRAVEGSTALAASEKSHAFEAGLRALRDHLQRTGTQAEAEPAAGEHCYRIRHALPDDEPLVSLIIPTRDKVELVRDCVESIRERTEYENYEIVVVDNASTDPETLAYLEQIGRLHNCRVLSYRKPFNYSAINNFAVKRAKGSIVGLINNDVEVISPGWLGEMVSWAVQPDIGCVGAKLYYPNDTIQHAGVILGLGGVAGHGHRHCSRDHPGYFSRLMVVQNLSAVTGACLLVQKRIYAEVGGLNERYLAVAFNDVDFCLKVRDRGYHNVWTPYAELYHHESISRGAEDNAEKMARFNAEVSYMYETWKLVPDPFYSESLPLDREDFGLSMTRR